MMGSDGLSSVEVVWSPVPLSGQIERGRPYTIAVKCEWPEAQQDRDEEIERLRDALSSIRGAVLGRLDHRGKLTLINEIVGEVLYGDFPGTLVRAYKDGDITR